MSTNASSTTANYGLSQWAEGDRILREDFNHDNAAIDAALHTQAAQTAAAVKAVEEKISLVRLFQTTLTSATASLSIDLSAIDLSQYIELELCVNSVTTSASTENALFSATVSNGSESYDLAIATLYGGYKYYTRSRFADGGALFVRTEGHYIQSSDVILSLGNVYAWRKHTLAEVRTMTLKIAAGKLVAGTSIVLYGRKK